MACVAAFSALPQPPALPLPEAVALLLRHSEIISGFDSYDNS